MSNKVPTLRETIDPEIFEGYRNKLRDRFYSLLCEREEGGKWERFVDTLFIELLGYARELNSIHFWMLLGKLASLKYLSYEHFRATVFECMNLIGRVEL